MKKCGSSSNKYSSNSNLLIMKRDEDRSGLVGTFQMTPSSPSRQHQRYLGVRSGVRSGSSNGSLSRNNSCTRQRSNSACSNLTRDFFSPSMISDTASSTSSSCSFSSSSITASTMIEEIDDFASLLCGGESVDLDRLRDLARFGIPAPYRWISWCHLMGISEESDEMVKVQPSSTTFPFVPGEVGKMIRLSVNKYVSRYRSYGIDGVRLETLASTIISGQSGDVEFLDNFRIEGLVSMIGVFILTEMPDPFIVQCLCKMIDARARATTPTPTQSSTRMTFDDNYNDSFTRTNSQASLKSLLRKTFPEFYSFLVEERVIEPDTKSNATKSFSTSMASSTLMASSTSKSFSTLKSSSISKSSSSSTSKSSSSSTSSSSSSWIESWQRNYLARELDPFQVQRLWDVYFSRKCWAEAELLHNCVCLSLLYHLQELVMEHQNDLDQQELFALLDRYPSQQFNIDPNQLFYSFFKTLVGKQVTIELKNDVKMQGKLHSVDQFLNLKLDDMILAGNGGPRDERYPHLWAIDRCFIRGSVVRYVHLPQDQVDVELLEDATRREAEGQHE